jgi:NAD(P)-dependent dehydrogenase (short-subunit alcohol dehydrogenase family)
LLARGAVRLERTVEEVTKMGGQALAIEVDVADPDAVEAAAAQIEEELGPIDIWINNAAVATFGRIMEMSPDEIRRVTDVNYHGAVWGTKAALARMRERGYGTIVQVGSALAYRALPLWGPYCASKHALRAFTDGLRVELLRERSDVHLTMVHPAFINTPLYIWGRNLMEGTVRPIPPVYQPQIAADVIHWAAHARRRHVLLGWSTIGLVVAHTLAPGLLDLLFTQTTFQTSTSPEPVLPDQADNLFEPIELDFGVEGPYDEIAQRWAPLAKLATRLSRFALRPK